MALELNDVHSDMLEKIPDRYQKSPGFPAYDFTAAFALAVLSLDGDISQAEARLDVDNLTGTDLDEYIKTHRGLFRKYATFASTTLRVVSGAGEVRAGDLFATEGGVEFYALSDGSYSEGDSFPVRAYEGGTQGTVGANTILYMPVTIPGILKVTNDGPATGGFDQEPDDVFRARFYEAMQNPDNGSNQQAYINWAMSVDGVGRVRIFPQAFGDNTVEVCIVDPNMEPAGAETIQRVQEVIDPNGNGDGSGEAPIGAMTTVTTATALTITVSANIQLEDGYDLETVRATIQRDLTAYLREVAFTKALTYVSYAQMSIVLGTAEGVLDFSNLTLNGLVGNVAVDNRQTPMLGTVVLV